MAEKYILAPIPSQDVLHSEHLANQATQGTARFVPCTVQYTSNKSRTSRRLQHLHS
jgi:hypothetical protein